MQVTSSLAAEDVRALIGVLTLEQNVSKGIVTTTSQFATGIEKDENINRLIPFRLELRNGKDLHDWLSKLSVRAKHCLIRFKFHS